MTKFLSLDDVVAIAVREFGEPAPVRDIGLLDSAVGRPQTTVFGEDAYPDLWTKASAFMQSLVVNHALVDGNKRLGWMATVVFIALNAEIDISSVDHDTAYDLVIDIATDSSLSVDDIAPPLKTLFD